MGLIPHHFTKELFFNFMKSSELVMVYLNLFSFIIFGNYKWLFVGFSLIVSAFINYYLKHNIAIPLFKKHNDVLPIFGPGKRPDGANDCGYFSNCPKLPAKSYGFPSGHSQFAGFQCAFLIRDILYRKTRDGKFKNLNLEDKISVVVLILLIFAMMYSRVYIEKCHTIQQTIFGAAIGVILGFFSHRFYIEFETKVIYKYPNFFKNCMPLIKILISSLFMYAFF